MRFAFAVVMGWGALAAATTLTSTSSPSPVGPVEMYGYSGASSGQANFTFEDLARLVTNDRTPSIERVLSRLPENLRSNYILMYRSRSLQRATFQRPRAILFEKDATFLMSFGALETDLRGAKALEVVQFRPATKSWEFREITFNEGGRPQISEPNPRKCLECHQSQSRAGVDPRPNWEPYAFWPGAYGSADGQVGATVSRYHGVGSRARPGDEAMVEGVSREKDEIEKFLADVKPTHPRYRYLGEFQPRHAVNITQMLHWPNFQRIVRLASATPDFELYKDSLLEIGKCHAAFGSEHPFVPDALPLGLRDFFRDAYDRFFVRDSRRIGVDPSQAYLTSALSSYTLTRNIDSLFASRGVDVSDWSMDFKTDGRFAFAERMGGPGDNRPLFRDALDRQFPEDRDVPCDEIRARARTAWTPVVAEGALQRALAARSLMENAPVPSPEANLARCVRCHSAEGPGKAIPFDDPLALARALRTGSYPRGTLFEEIRHRLSDVASFDEQMPPNRVLSSEERSALISHLDALR